ncbi:MAG TPA: protein-tyrosine phosphatase family protein [Rhabdochlamydiaceae bacterium]|nr:protein-tyrosine phosphatase family protein [Rhabdochlamydiaceae bacterium]
MKVTPSSQAQKSGYLPLDAASPYVPRLEQNTITSLRDVSPKLWVLLKLTSFINFLKSLLGIKYLSFYYATWVFEKKIALAKSPKEHEIESFWQMVWSTDVSVIAAFSDPTPNSEDLSCIYWPTSSFTKADILIKLKSEAIEYSSQNQLLIKREFLLEKGKKSRTIVQLISFPDATKTTYEKAILAAKAHDKKNQTILALYSGRCLAAYPFINLYKSNRA